MIFAPTAIDGAQVVDFERHADERGWFARAWSSVEFERHGIGFAPVDINLSQNATRGTLRGMHFQLPPHHEVKLVRCIRGSVYDVIVDLRQDSPTYRAWFGVELSAANGRLLHVPAGCAHGYQTLVDDAELLYVMSAGYEPAAARGVRFDDPAFAIEWPDAGTRVIAERDRTWPDYTRELYDLAGLRG